jgi:peptidoglycan hydrolase-like protein with peptidoglycan-binding domain
MGRLKRLTGGLGLFVAVTLLAPLAALTVLGIRAASQSPLESASLPEPLIATVQSASRAHEVVVAIKVEYADPVAAVINASGVLTSVGIAPGSVVQTGTLVGTVNDAHVIAYASPTPLWRDLGRGVAGPDVAIAQSLMASLGYYSGPADGKVGLGTEKAFKAFNAAHGYGTGNGLLTLGSLVWVGPVPVTVASVAVAAGDAVTPGSDLFTATSGAADIKVTESASVPRDQPVSLVVGDTVTPYVVGSGRITDPAAVAAITATLGALTEGTGTIRLDTPVVVGTMPSSAVVSDPAGVTCFFPDVTGAGVAIEPLGGSLGTIDVDPSLVGRPILINPREVREDLSCGS